MYCAAFIWVLISTLTLSSPPPPATLWPAAFSLSYFCNFDVFHWFYLQQFISFCYIWFFWYASLCYQCIMIPSEHSVSEIEDTTVIEGVITQSLFDLNLQHTHTHTQALTYRSIWLNRRSKLLDAVVKPTAGLFSNENYSVAVVIYGSAKSHSSNCSAKRTWTACWMQAHTISKPVIVTMIPALFAIGIDHTHMIACESRFSQ